MKVKCISLLNNEQTVQVSDTIRQLADFIVVHQLSTEFFLLLMFVKTSDHVIAIKQNNFRRCKEYR